jgi:PAS domain-containing protein
MGKSRKTERKALQQLQQATIPVYLLDQRRRIQFCNDACARWVGVEVETLIGCKCDYHSQELPEGDRFVSVRPLAIR